MNYYDIEYSVKDKDGKEIDKGVNLYVGEAEPDTTTKTVNSQTGEYPEGHAVEYTVTQLTDEAAQSRFHAPNTDTADNQPA